MCYTKPGPRCSSHARKTLTKIESTYKFKMNNLNEFDKQDLRQAKMKAQLNYYGTPAGKIEMSSRIKSAPNDKVRQKLEDFRDRAVVHRKEQMDQYKKAKKIRVSTGNFEKVMNSNDMKFALASIDIEDEYFPSETTRNTLVAYAKKYGQVRCGANRAVFDRGDGTVVKIPIADMGFYVNGRELSHSKNQDENTYIPLAECFAYSDHNVDPQDELAMIVMEKVEIYQGNGQDLPSWVGVVDCGQVGYTKQGKLVAYDL